MTEVQHRETAFQPTFILGEILAAKTVILLPDNFPFL